MKFLKKATIRFLFLFCLLFLGCKEHKTAKKSNPHSEVTAPRLSENFRIVDGDLELDFKLPDTIAQKDTIKGYIVYKSRFDSLQVTPSNNHFVNLYFANTKEISKDFEEFQTKKLDTFTRIHDSLLIIHGINFKKKGNHLLEGYIVDYLYNDVGSDSVRYRTIKNHIIYEVYVE